MKHQKVKILKGCIDNLLKNLFFITFTSISACSYNANITLTADEKLILEKSICKGPSLIFVNTPVNADIVKRWNELCPLRDVGLTDKKSVKAPMVTAADSFAPKDIKIKNTAFSGTGPFCPSEPLLQTFTAFIIPLICNYEDNFGPCIKIGSRQKCVSPPIKGESVEYIGWITIFTHGIPHAIGSLWSDRMEDRIIAAIDKELIKFK